MCTHESYVSLETAKMLKEAGFDWWTNQYYGSKTYLKGTDKEVNPDAYSLGEMDWRVDDKLTHGGHKNDDTISYSAPTLDVAQRWLREVGNKNGTVILTLNFNENISKHWEVKGIHLNKDRTVMQWFYTCHVKPYERGIIPVDCFDTYEEAQEAGIKKALEILLEKGE